MLLNISLSYIMAKVKYNKKHFTKNLKFQVINPKSQTVHILPVYKLFVLNRKAFVYSMIEVYLT